MSIHQLAHEICERGVVEGVTHTQVRDVLRCLGDVLKEQPPAAQLMILVRLLGAQ